VEGSIPLKRAQSDAETSRVVRSIGYVGLGFALLTAAFQAIALIAGATTNHGWIMFLCTVPLALASLFLSRKGGSRIGKRISKVTVGVAGVFFGIPFAALALGFIAYAIWYPFEAFWS
jgi:hypothetical protein